MAEYISKRLLFLQLPVFDYWEGQTANLTTTLICAAQGFGESIKL